MFVGKGLIFYTEEDAVYVLWEKAHFITWEKGKHLCCGKWVKNCAVKKRSKF